MNNWGSTWEFTFYTNQNWWDLTLSIDARNAGGSQFAGPPTSQATKREGVNPLVRVQSRQPELISETPDGFSDLQSSDTTQSEFTYATESFDRQRASHGDQSNSRWQAVQQGLQVPVLDDRLHVAFQKFLRDEEAEFMLLVIAAEEGSHDAIH